MATTHTTNARQFTASGVALEALNEPRPIMAWIPKQDHDARVAELQQLLQKEKQANAEMVHVLKECRKILNADGYDIDFSILRGVIDVLKKVEG